MRKKITNLTCVVLGMLLCMGNIFAQKNKTTPIILENQSTDLIIFQPEQTVHTMNLEQGINPINKAVPSFRAGSDVIFSEGFEGTTSNDIPAGWTRSGETITGSSAVAGAWCSAADWTLVPTVTPYSGRMMVAQAYNATTMNAWLFSSGVELTAENIYEISFVLKKVQIGGFIPDAFKVQISSVNTETGMTNADTLYINTTDFFDWKKITVNYPVKTTGIYYLGFHCYTGGTPTTRVGICLDNVSIVELPKNDLEVTPSFPYSQVPVSQTFSPTMSARVKNVGTTPQTDVTLSVKHNGIVVGTSTPIPTLAPFTENTITVTISNSTVTLGENTLTFTVSQNETDENPINNTATLTFIGTRNMYATDNGTPISSIGTSKGSSIGNIYTITQETMISQVMVGLQNSGTGMPNTLDYEISLYKLNSDGTVPDDAEFTQTVTRSANGIFTYSVPPTVLTPANYFLCAKQLDATALQIYRDGVPGRVFYIRGENSPNYNTYNTYGAAFIRMIIDRKNNDLQVLANGFPYTMIPQAQAAFLPFPAKLSGKAYNAGLKTQTNVKLSATLNETPIGTSSPIASLASATTSETMTINTLTGTAFPTSLGNNSVVYTVSQDEIEENPDDNSQTYSFEITNDKYAIDGVVDVKEGGFGSDKVDTKMGNIFKIANTTTIKKVEVGFYPAPEIENLSFSVAMYKMTNDTIISPTALFIQQAKRPIEGWITIDIPETKLITPGDYLLAVIQSSTDNPKIAYDGVPGRLCHAVASGSTKLVPQNIGALAIRMIINPSIVKSLSPEKDAENVAVNAEVSVTFNANVTEKDLSGITINGEPFTANIDGNKLIIAHNDFKYDTTYTVVIPASTIEGYDEEITWSFTTEKEEGISVINKDGIKIYPNPSSGLIYVTVSENSAVSIFDVTGRIVNTHNVDANATVTITQPAGLYFVKVESNGKISTHKLVINK